MVDLLRRLSIGAYNLQETEYKYKTRHTRLMAKESRRRTHTFPLIQVILALTPVALEFGAHIGACTDDGNGVFESFRYHWVVHFAFADGACTFSFTHFDKLTAKL